MFRTHREHHAADPVGFLERREKQKERNRLSVRAASLRVNYGISPEDYERMLSQQGGVCAICGIDGPRAAGRRYFYVDHCHRTEVVRGLLCDGCNRGLGYFRDDPEALIAAAEYLRKSLIDSLQET